MNVLLILNDAPYGTERTFNGLRLALALVRRPDTRVTVFLMAGAVAAAKRGQITPDGHYNLERMLKRIAQDPHRVLLCDTCMDGRGLVDGEVVDGTSRGSIDELATETLSADQVVVF